MWRFRRVHRQLGWKFWAFICGGAALDQETETFWGRLGFAVIQGYGMTETTSLVSVNHPFKLSRGSIGKVLAGREVRLAENGEILVRGESIAAGYWQGKELKPVLGEEGWLHTGDMGALDADGNLYFKGRGKNVIVTPEGMNVYPEDLEAALQRQPEVRDCAVVPLESSGNAEACAVLLLRGDARDGEAAIKRANESLAAYQQIRRWVVWPKEDFPRTSTQKPRINLLQEFVRAQEKQQAAVPPQGTLAELIARVTGRAPAGLSPDSNLATDLNLNSIDRVELMSAMEDRFQMDLNEKQFASAATVRELEQMLRQVPSPRSLYGYPRWAQHWPVTWIRFLVYYLLVWPATLLLVWPSVRVRENLRGLKELVLVISNHITSVDIGFLLWALPAGLRHRVAVTMLGERLQQMRHPPAEKNFLLRWFSQILYALVVALFHVFPLPQRSGFRESFRYVGELADRGFSAVVFPEGRRTADGRMAPFQAGIGLLAANLCLPIVPMRIQGLFELKQKRQRFARRSAVQVWIGAPVQFERDTDPDKITCELERIVTALGA
jgi:long-chain acyl-CoA synthetase